jgi:hypothetical protein
MFDAFISLHVLLCDAMLLYFIFVNRICLNFEFVVNSNIFLQTKNVLVITEKDYLLSLYGLGPKPYSTSPADLLAHPHT